MDGLGSFDPSSDFSLALDAPRVEEPYALSFVPSAAVSVNALAPRYPLSETLIGVLRSCIRPGDPRYLVVADTLANNGYVNCEDLCELDKSWYAKDSGATLSPPDYNLRRRLMELLCGNSVAHKNYDHLGKFFKAAALKHASLLSGEVSTGVRAIPTFHETSIHLRHCLERKARDYSANALILTSLLRLVDIDNNGKQMCVADDVSDVELEPLPVSFLAPETDDDDEDDDSSSIDSDAETDLGTNKSASALYEHLGAPPAPLLCSPGRSRMFVLDADSGQRLHLRAAAAACSEHAKQSSDRCIRVRQAKAV
jgi:hypothetical protein